ncbi:unnamed protein product [Diamesa serratosioi]
MLRHLSKVNVLQSLLSTSKRGVSTSQCLRDIFKVQDEKDFEEKVKNSKTPVVVDFFATWCNPCKMLTPRIESIISENEGKISLAKVDIDELTELSLEYGIQSVPVLVVMRNGKVEKKLVGLQDTDKLRAWVESSIAGK